MAKVGGFQIPEEFVTLFNQLIRRMDSRQTGAVGTKKGIQTREAKRDVARRSFMPEISELWAGLSEAEKDAWNAAGAESLYSGWNQFLQDTSYRLKFGLSGLATPSTLYQYKVGKILIEAPADSATIRQLHPRRYFVRRRVPNTKDVWTDVAIDEILMLPLEVGISYKTDLEATVNEPVARFYAEVESHYQGQKIHTDVGFDLPLESDWSRDTAILSEVVGLARSYTLFIELVGVRGSIKFDNLLSYHSGDNFARDFRCTNINQPLSPTHFMISPAWEAVNMPVGTDWDSVYHELP